MPSPNDFDHYREPVLVLARELYLAAQEGIDHPLDIEPDLRTPAERQAVAERVMFLPPNPETIGAVRTPADADLAFARILGTSRTVASLACLEDDRDRRSPIGLLASIEIGIRRVVERRRLEGVFGEDSMIDAVRGKS